MSAPLFTLSDQAKQEFIAALEWSERHFGEKAAIRYKELLRVAFVEIGNDPEVLGSTAFEGFRLYHLRQCRRKAVVEKMIVKSPRHFLLYRIVKGNVEISRILYDRMDIESLLKKTE